MNPATALAVPCFRPEEKCFILFDRTAHGVTKIVAAQQLLFAAGVGRRGAPALEEVILGVQSVVPAKVVEVAMKLVGSALGYDIDLRAGGAAVLGSVGVALDFELFDSVDGGVGQNRALR